MIVLASQSEIRRQLLTAAGVTFITVTSPIDEAALQADLQHVSPKDVAIKLAHAKADALNPQQINDMIIGVDQTFELEGEVFHKPKNRDQAKQQLQRMSGRTHCLHTAYAMFRNRQPIADHCETATLTMRTLSDDFIDGYIASTPDTILASVGCYQLEGLGIQLMQDIKGDYFSILGLPLLPLLAHLRQHGGLAT
jgi:septum formation protein